MTPEEIQAIRERAEAATKTCSDCGEGLPLDCYYRRNADRLRAQCKSCWKIRTDSWRVRNPEKVKAMNSAEHRGLERVAEYNRRYIATHQKERQASHRRVVERDPRKQVAWTAVQSAVRNGSLVRPDACERCGRGQRRIEASHDDYDLPLTVEWLCVPCHRKKDSDARAL